MRFWIIVLFASFSFIGIAQEVNVDGSLYRVKGKTILKNGEDVTATLSVEKQQQILIAFRKKSDELNEVKKNEEKVKKQEKALKNAEKKQKKAEKALKQKEKLQSSFEKSGNKYNDAVKKYEKLKKKGKLSSDDETKWLKKIEKLKVNHEKAKRKLK